MKGWGEIDIRFCVVFLLADEEGWGIGKGMEEGESSGGRGVRDKKERERNRWIMKVERETQREK